MCSQWGYGSYLAGRARTAAMLPEEPLAPQDKAGTWGSWWCWRGEEAENTGDKHCDTSPPQPALPVACWHGTCRNLLSQKWLFLSKLGWSWPMGSLKGAGSQTYDELGNPWFQPCGSLIQGQQRPAA